ncbi:exodeoxyribonuclease VII large subunit [Thalassotalea agarivorans]|uniref:Exodeoxyribonuclease 7 large subunit n=1 Tax=Thalassotalea agarivorans TaxID=349064 RepID=A0A1H9YG08_THASX|nr:exodeoxyribonuclease VII large subunit [Thalassotalea agarivorans]SES67384.1 Exodeoxyribonuclease VII large subunit [Thalassotalea agarivorans]
MTTKNILKVSQLTKQVRFLLESEMRTVWLTGEISNFVAASSGHWYLSLKDERSQVKCAMFRGNNIRAKIKPNNGLQVLVKARVSLYEPRGDFQLIIEQMEDAGAGLLQQQYEALKNKLHAEGLFDLSYKKTLPEQITKVGIVTSATGAAVKDILTVLNRRDASIEAIVYPVLVQGEQASLDIANTIALANARQEVDVLIVGRGGGSIEDLWSFNEERVVRAIFDSHIPVISAVGHETDTTLADFVADMRAPTPSAAAELVSKDVQTKIDKLNKLKQQLSYSYQQVCHRNKQRIAYLQHRLSQTHPEQQILHKAQRIDELTARLTSVSSKLTSVQSQSQQYLHNRLLAVSPEHSIVQMKQTCIDLSERTQQAFNYYWQKKTADFGHLAEQLHMVSPLATIARGYGVVRDNQQNIVNSTSQVSKGEEIAVQLKDGELFAQVTEIKPK